MPWSARRSGELPTSHGVAKTFCAHIPPAVAQLLSQLADAIVPHRGAPNPQGVSNILWAFATAGLNAQPLGHVLAQDACRIVHEFNAQDVSNVLWSLCKLGVRDDPLFSGARGVAMRVMDNFTAQGLSNTVYAVALTYNEEVKKYDLSIRLFEAMARGGQRRLTPRT